MSVAVCEALLKDWSSLTVWTLWGQSKKEMRSFWHLCSQQESFLSNLPSPLWILMLSIQIRLQKVSGTSVWSFVWLLKVSSVVSRFLCAAKCQFFCSFFCPERPHYIWACAKVHASRLSLGSSWCLQTVTCSTWPTGTFLINCFL